MENMGRKYSSTKRRGHVKQKCDRAEWHKEHEARAHPYEVCPATHQKHVHGSTAVDTKLDLMGISIMAFGYIGLCDAEELKDKTAYKLDNLVGKNSCFKFKLQKWDGR